MSRLECIFFSVWWTFILFKGAACEFGIGDGAKIGERYDYDLFGDNLEFSCLRSRVE